MLLSGEVWMQTQWTRALERGSGSMIVLRFSTESRVMKREYKEKEAVSGSQGLPGFLCG